MEPDQTIVILKETLTGIALSLGDLPLPKFEHLNEWKTKAPAIIQTAQSVALALQLRVPTIAQILDEVATECDVMLTAIDRDRDRPPTVIQVAAREKRISELQGAVQRMMQSL